MSAIANLDSVVDQIRRTVDIREFVGQYVTLKKQGARWMAPCPFHTEKDASFGIPVGKDFFKCFGCGAGGSVFDFLMRIEGVDFIGAVRILAEHAGIALEEAKKETRQEREQDLEARIRAIPYVAWEITLRRTLEFAIAAFQWKQDRCEQYCGARPSSDEDPRYGAAADLWFELEARIEEYQTARQTSISAPAKLKVGLYRQRASWRRLIGPLPAHIRQIMVEYEAHLQALQHEQVMGVYEVLSESPWFFAVTTDLKRKQDQETLETLRDLWRRAVEFRRAA